MVQNAGAALPAYEVLASRRSQLDRASRSSQIADIVRASILDGTFRPGSRLSEPDICAALGVSRNTLREAFASLVDQRLTTHELNRGMFVRVPTRGDVRDLYGCRRIIQGAAVRRPTPRERLTGVRAAVEAAEEAAARDDWTSVGTADIAFHRAITALNESARLDAFMGGLWNELRLVFHVMDDPAVFHRPYLTRNRELLETVEAGDPHRAEAQLLAYLDDAETQIIAAYP